MSHPQQDNERDADELSRSLRELRAHTGMGQIPAARSAGISQAKLSRAENGQGVLRSNELVALLAAYDVSQAMRERLALLTDVRRAERVDARLILQAGAHHIQRRGHELEQTSRHVRSYQPGIVLGIAQTAEYASAVLSQRSTGEDDVAERVAVRARRRSLLDDTNRQWTLIQTEGALRWHMGGPELMSAQLHDLIVISRQPNVRLGIVDWRIPATFTAPHGFHVYDARAVQVGTRDGTAFLTDSGKVADYRTLFGQLETLAVFGDDARAILTTAANQYLGVLGSRR